MTSVSQQCTDVLPCKVRLPRPMELVLASLERGHLLVVDYQGRALGKARRKSCCGFYRANRDFQKSENFTYHLLETAPVSSGHSQSKGAYPAHSLFCGANMGEIDGIYGG